MSDRKIKVQFNRTDYRGRAAGGRIETIDIIVPKGASIKEAIRGLKTEYSRRLGIPVSKIEALIRKPPISEAASITVTLNGRKRNIIWQALYSKRAQGGYSDRPEDAKALEEIMDSMRII